MFVSFFFFNDTATTEIYTLSLHDALPIFVAGGDGRADLVARHERDVVDGEDVRRVGHRHEQAVLADARDGHRLVALGGGGRSEEHTSELQSRQYLVCRLLLEKKKKTKHQ